MEKATMIDYIHNLLFHHLMDTQKERRNPSSDLGEKGMNYIPNAKSFFLLMKNQDDGKR